MNAHLARRLAGLSVGVGCLLLPARPAGAAEVDAFDFGGHNYRLYNDNVTWPVASANAAALAFAGQPGHLARVDSAGENARLFQSLLDHTGQLTGVAPDGGGGRYAWLGGTDQAAEGDWRWSDNNDAFWGGGPGGGPVGGRYRNWGTTAAQNEPDNFTSMIVSPLGQDYLGLSINGWPLGVAGQWNDLAIGNSLPYFIEFDVPEPGAVAMIVALGAVPLLGCSRATRFSRKFETPHGISPRRDRPDGRRGAATPG